MVLLRLHSYVLLHAIDYCTSELPLNFEKINTKKLQILKKGTNFRFFLKKFIQNFLIFNRKKA